MHTLRDFKSFAEAEIDLFRPVTLLIGPNGSGKSNLIEGVELLAQIAHGRPLHEIVDVGRGHGSGHEVRGGLGGCVRHGRQRFRLGLKDAIVPFRREAHLLGYHVEIAASPSAHVAAEILAVVPVAMRKRPARAILSTAGGYVAHAGARMVQYDNFKRGQHKPRAPVSADRSALSQYERFAVDCTQAEECAGLVAAVRSYLRSAVVFDPSPGAMRDYARQGDSALARNAANLSAVLHSIDGTESLGRILALIHQVPEEPITGFRFVTTELGDVMFAFETEGESPIDARRLSDGTLRCLAVLTALETVEEGSRVIIEEIDNGLHPSRVDVLVQALYECAERRHLNVLATTHNPATLNALTPEQWDSVVVCVRDGPENTSRLVPLPEVPGQIELRERGRLGDLVTRGVLERHLEGDYEEDRKRRIAEWLEKRA
jgi:predicted ATPase